MLREIYFAFCLDCWCWPVGNAALALKPKHLKCSMKCWHLAKGLNVKYHRCPVLFGAQLYSVLLWVESDLCLGWQTIQAWPNSSWYETGYRERGESDPVSESSSQQEAGSFPCLAMTSASDAVVRIASVPIGKYFQVVVHTASPTPWKSLENQKK